MSATWDATDQIVRPTRRQVLRERTALEIRETARHQLRTIAASDLSLRAVARDLGMTAPALYRYYDGRDALLEALSVDAYDALTARLEGAAQSEPSAAPAARLTAASLAYRRWALDCPHEFALVFGTPVPGFAPGDDSPIGQAGARFGEAFLRLLRAAVTASDQVQHLASAQLPPALQHRLTQIATVWDAPTPPWLVQLWLSCWARLHGAVSLEVFGHLRFLTDVERPGTPSADAGEQLYRSVLAELAALYGIGDVATALTLAER